MDAQEEKGLNILLEALSFYANAHIYWGEPISLDLKLDRETLKMSKESHEKSQIMIDRGELARQALYAFEGMFSCEYVIEKTKNQKPECNHGRCCR